MARNRVIGKGGTLPWHLPEDLKRFRSLTMGHPIIMGRKTYDSIGRPLPGRRNIVISRNSDLTIEGVETAISLQAALEMTIDADEVFVIGGQQIYQLALPLGDRIELTLIDRGFDGDVLFPEIDPAEWEESQRESREDAASDLKYDFIRLDRIRQLGDD
ncbi:MAG: dihydrofolate reductase [Betaproteobacteria bacterium]|nr:MAG: dihydrofolate reductase [Betaproteobacteria bacterium]